MQDQEFIRQLKILARKEKRERVRRCLAKRGGKALRYPKKNRNESEVRNG